MPTAAVNAALARMTLGSFVPGELAAIAGVAPPAAGAVLVAGAGAGKTETTQALRDQREEAERHAEFWRLAQEAGASAAAVTRSLVTNLGDARREIDAWRAIERCPPGTRRARDTDDDACVACGAGRYNHGNMGDDRERCYAPDAIKNAAYANATDVRCSAGSGAPTYDRFGRHKGGCEGDSAP